MSHLHPLGSGNRQKAYTSLQRQLCNSVPECAVFLVCVYTCDPGHTHSHTLPAPERTSEAALFLPHGGEGEAGNIRTRFKCHSEFHMELSNYS